MPKKDRRKAVADARTVAHARALENKALQCLTIAQRLLPWLNDADVEAQATDFMPLPQAVINATIERINRTATEDKKGNEKPEADEPEVLLKGRNRFEILREKHAEQI